MSATLYVPADATKLPVLTYEQFRKLYKATRNFQRYTSQDRADIAASHRQGHVQRQAVGEFYYTHDLCPGVAFDTAQQATRHAYDAYLASVQGRDELLAALSGLLASLSPAFDYTGVQLVISPTDKAVINTAMRHAREAIAKASGGQS